VIDVNLPRHTTDQSDEQEHEESISIEYRIREATALLTYLWDNYIELNDATHVFLMGTNTGHGAIINFMKDHEESAVQRITRAISFVEDVPLQSCKSATNEDMPRWYYEHSLVFVSEDHNFWSSEYSRKIKRRFGRMHRSPPGTISDMLSAHEDDVTGWILRDTAGWQPPQDRDDDEAMVVVPTLGPEATREPPIGNFALSPSKTAASSQKASPGLLPSAMPREGRAMSPRLEGSPKQPPIANFALSPKAAMPKSPAR
jgi:histone deacetylase 6